MERFLTELLRKVRALKRAMAEAKRSSRTVKRLLYKEIKLAASPLTFFFIAFGAMTLLPGYPILVGGIFVCLGIFYSFQAAREASDLLYTVLLPVAKTDVVAGKYAFVCLIEMLAFALMAALTVVRMTALAGAPVYVNNVMMAANPLFLGFALLLFAAFNLLFVGGFFKTAYNFGRPLVGFIIAAVLIIGVGETLHHIPGLEFLNRSTGELMWVQYVALAVCAAAYALGTWWSCGRSMERFEKIDL